MSDHKKFENLNLDPSLTEDKMDTLKSGQPSYNQNPYNQPMPYHPQKQGPSYSHFDQRYDQFHDYPYRGQHQYMGSQHQYMGSRQNEYPHMQGQSSYAHELDKAYDKNIEDVKLERREKVERQAHTQHELNDAKEERDRKVQELETQLLNKKSIAENSSQEQNKSLVDYNQGPHRNYYTPYGQSPYHGSYAFDRQREQLNVMGEKRFESTRATSDFQQTKKDAEHEAEELDRKVDDLEKQLTNAKELRRRNSLKLEQVVQSQESAPFRSHAQGQSGQNKSVANARSDDIKRKIDFEQKTTEYKMQRSGDNEKQEETTI